MLYIARQIGNSGSCREGSSAKMGNKEIGGHCLYPSFLLIYLLDTYSPVFLVNGFPRGSLNVPPLGHHPRERERSKVEAVRSNVQTLLSTFTMENFPHTRFPQNKNNLNVRCKIS